MKKVLLLHVMLLVAGFGVVQAQIQRGNVLVGADIANFQLGLREGNHFEMLINPKVAWFIEDNVALGGFFDVGIDTDKGEGSDFTYGVGALGRYYTGPASAPIKHTRFFAEANVGIQGYNPRVGDNTNGLGIGIGPGIAYFITPNIGLEGLFKYNGIIGFGQAATNHLLSLNVGFQVYLPGRTVKAAIENVK